MPPTTVPIENYVQGILSGFKFYKEAVVLDYIDNPAFITADQVEAYGSNFTHEMIQRCPRGTIVGYPVGEASSSRLFYPFFSNHLFLPVKPGEFVWYFEYGRIPYWMSRRVADFGYEDVNYTMATNANRSKKISSAAVSPKSVYAGDSPDLSGDPAQSLGNQADLTLSMLPADLTFDSIKKNSIAAKDLVYEPVPVYSGKCSELVIQGSNNTSIVQGSNFGGGTELSSGYVDITAGRGQSGSGSEVTVLEDQDPPVASREVLNPNEGETSISTDASRILVSHGMDPDDLFQTALPGGTINQSFSPSIVSKSDKIRVIARSDVAVSVEGSNGCSVVLNSNGDIYVNPAASGKVYLSGPGSDQSYVRYDELKDLLDIMTDLLESVGVVTAALVTTVPGAQALDPTGQIASLTTTLVAQGPALKSAFKSRKIVGS